MSRQTASLYACLVLLVFGLNSALFRRADPTSQPNIAAPETHLDDPAAAIAWRELSLQDENGEVRADGLMNARAQVEGMRAAQPTRPSEAGITPGAWTSIGPGNIGGRIRAIAIHPTTPDTMFLGGVAGGIWRSHDGGTTWAIVDDFMGNLAISSIVFTPGNPSVMYAATGEGFPNGDRIRGAGVFKSNDGGTTWTQLPATSTSPSSGLSAGDFYFLSRLAIASNGTLLVSSTTGIFRSTDGGQNFTRATLTGGGVLNPGVGIVDVDFDPANSSNAIAGSYDRALYSLDGGATWAAATGIPAPAPDTGTRVELVYAASNTSIVYAGVDLDNGSLFKSTDGGRGYVEIYDGATGQVESSFALAPYGTQGFYSNLLWVSPTDPNLIVWGGLDLHRSTNGGLNWAQISGQGIGFGYQLSNPTTPHVDQHIAIAHPNYNGTTNRTVFFGNDGGLYRAADIVTVGGGGSPYQAGWTELNNGLGITQFYGAAGHAATGRVTGGTQDNGSPYFDPAMPNASEAWVDAFPGFDGGFAAYDPVDANLFYGSTQNLRIHRTMGTPGQASSEFIASETQQNGLTDAGTARAAFIAPLMLDPHDANTMLAGGASLWRSRNVKATPPTFEEIRSAGPEGALQQIVAIAAARTNASGRSNVIWVGARANNSFGVYRTVDAAGDDPVAIRSTWAQMGGGALPTRLVTEITIQPNAPNVVYVAFGGFSPDNLWKSTDGGVTWSDITGSGTTGLPDAPVRDIAIHPTNSNWLYAATEVGIFASEDGGATWGVPHDGPANVSVDDLFFLDTTLYAVTHGRGIFRAVVSLSPTRPTISAIGSVSALDGASVSAPFTIGDPNTPLGGLTVTAASSNPDVIPSSALIVTGSGANRTITINMPAGVSGFSVITVTVSDGTESAASAFTAAVLDRSPVVSFISDVVLEAGATGLTVPFTISDPDSAISSLSLSASTPNNSFLPMISVAGSGTNRTVTLTIASGQYGRVAITLTITDGQRTSSRTFYVIVLPPTTAPQITSRLLNYFMPQTALALNINVAIEDIDTPVSNLVVLARSSNQNIIADSGITLSETGVTRAMRMVLQRGVHGTTFVTLSASDGTSTTYGTFFVTIINNATPTISPIPNLTIASGSSGTASFTVSDSDTPPASLTLAATSNNTTVIPNSNIVFGGSGANRTITVTSVAGRTGAANITVQVEDGVSGASTTFRVTVVDASMFVAPPSNFAIASASGNTVTFSWTPGTGGLPITSYLLEGGVTPGTTLGSLPLNTTGTSVTLTLPTGVFYLRLYALSGTTRSSVSNEIQAHINVPRPPSAPTNLLAMVNGSALGLSWRNTNAGGAPTSVVLDVSGPVTLSVPIPVTESFNHPAVPAGTYTFAVRAVNESGTSAASNSVTVALPAACSGVPLTPTEFLATKAGSTINLSWSPPLSGPAVDGYTLVVTGAFNTSVPTTMRALSGTVGPGSYTFSVFASNACGNSAPTTPQTVTMP